MKTILLKRVYITKPKVGTIVNSYDEKNYYAADMTVDSVTPVKTDALGRDYYEVVLSKEEDRPLVVNEAEETQPAPTQI